MKTVDRIFGRLTERGSEHGANVIAPERVWEAGSQPTANLYKQQKVMNKIKLLLSITLIAFFSVLFVSCKSSKQYTFKPVVVNTPATAVPIPADGKMKLGVWYSISGPFIPITNSPSVSTNQ